MADQETIAAAGEAPAPPTPAPPKFAGGPPRSRTVTLTYPVEYDGKVYRTITVTRMTVAQVRDFFNDIQEKGERAKPAMFDAPDAVLDALDPDDDDALGEAVRDFLPRRLQMDLGPIPADGDPTPPSSQAS